MWISSSLSSRFRLGAGAPASSCCAPRTGGTGRERCTGGRVEGESPSRRRGTTTPDQRLFLYQSAVCRLEDAQVVGTTLGSACASSSVGRRWARHEHEHLWGRPGDASARLQVCTRVDLLPAFERIVLSKHTLFLLIARLVTGMKFFRCHIDHLI